MIDIVMTVIAILLGISLVLPAMIPHAPKPVDLTVRDLTWFGSADMAYQSVLIGETAVMAIMNEHRDDDQNWWLELATCFGAIAVSARSWHVVAPPDTLDSLARDLNTWIEAMGRTAVTCQAESLERRLASCANELASADLLGEQLLDAMLAVRAAIREGLVNIVPIEPQVNQT